MSEIKIFIVMLVFFFFKGNAEHIFLTDSSLDIPPE